MIIAVETFYDPCRGRWANRIVGRSAPSLPNTYLDVEAASVAGRELARLLGCHWRLAPSDRRVAGG